MDNQLKQDLLIICASIAGDSLREFEAGNSDTAALLLAYAQDITEVIMNYEEDANATS